MSVAVSEGGVYARASHCCTTLCTAARISPKLSVSWLSMQGFFPTIGVVRHQPFHATPSLQSAGSTLLQSTIASSQHSLCDGWPRTLNK